MIRPPWTHRVHTRVIGAVLLAAFIGLLAKPCGAVPTLMNYQGYLTDSNNVPVTGSFPMNFNLFPDSTAGAALWTESYGSVAVSSGVFNVVLGTVTPLPPATFTGAKLWLQTTVSGSDIVPRRPIVTAAYAFRASVADSATNVPAGLGEIVGQVNVACAGNNAGVLVYIPGRSFVTYTGASGSLDLSSVPPGTYTLHVEGGNPPGSTDVSNVVVVAGGITDVGVITLGANTQTDPNNCGTCGTVCSFANATGTCASGVCQVGSCNAGFANCDGNGANGCEINTATSVNNCGACGNVCSFANATATCAGGACSIGSCNPGFANCDGNSANGCEINTATSVNNCGACGNVCTFANGSGGCFSGTCQLLVCNAGFANCDGNSANGCETNTNTSANNCGACGNVCGGGQTCVGGVCQ